MEKLHEIIRAFVKDVKKRFEDGGALIHANRNVPVHELSIVMLVDIRERLERIETHLADEAMSKIADAPRAKKAKKKTKKK